MIKILIVDDEKDILDFLSYNLKKNGYEVLTAANGKIALKVAQQERPDIILLDIMMPMMDGIETCRHIRSDPHLKDTLIAFLTARDEDMTQIQALDVGGDDFITKPIKPQVLLSRLHALLRRRKTEEQMMIKIADLEINRETVLVTRGEEIIELPRKEFELLWLLVSKPGKVFTREEIYTKIWGHDVIVGDRTMDVHIRKLREKIGSDYIKTLKGVGYKFDF
jgi:two-component system, OmpR family, alkaline phosphatase synthesis response regulator PhoP